MNEKLIAPYSMITEKEKESFYRSGARFPQRVKVICYSAWYDFTELYYNSDKEWHEKYEIRKRGTTEM